MINRFSPELIAKQYCSLYSDLMQRQDKIAGKGMEKR